MPEGELRERFLFELLRDAHGFAAGFDHDRPGELEPLHLPWRRRLERARQRAKAVAERGARRAGFNRRHFDPERASRRLGAILDNLDGLERTYEAMADDRSRQLLLDVLKLRTLGPSHVDLPVGAAEYRDRQARVDRACRSGDDAIPVTDPFLPRLHRYRVDGDVRLYSHSLVVLNMFELEQYAYRHGTARVEPEAGDVAIDAGGCWGDTALWLAERVGPEGRVYTFEFSPDSVEVLRRNLELNPRLAERVVVVEEALWDRTGERLEFAPAGQLTAVTRGGNGATRTVTTVTLDDFAEREGIERVGFLKMDVEGAEPNVLRGARRRLAEDSPKLAVAAYHADSDLAELPALVLDAQPGYRLYLDHFSPGEHETVLFGATG
ncbi:MAG: FkbM family methyltransferase [Actinomycetota bacterium]|nr:FkbM family methyltransferase [Actinomycetota bacterium]